MSTDLSIYRLLSELMQRSWIIDPLDLRPYDFPRGLKLQANRSLREFPIVVHSCSSGLITKKHTLDSAPLDHLVFFFLLRPHPAVKIKMIVSGLCSSFHARTNQIAASRYCCMHQSDRGIRDSLLHQSDRDNTSYTEYVSSFYFFPAPASFLVRAFLVFVKIAYMIGILIVIIWLYQATNHARLKKSFISNNNCLFSLLFWTLKTLFYSEIRDI